MTAAATEHWLCCDVIVDVTDDEWRHVSRLKSLSPVLSAR